MGEGNDQARLLKAFRDQESRLRGYLLRLTDTSEEVDDICQEALLRSLEAAKRTTVRNPSPFLFGIARNIVRRRFERKSRSLVDLVADFTPDDHVGDGRSLDDIMDEQERLARYDEAIARLPPKCRRVFVLAKVYGYTHREISEMLNIAVKTVENHVATGLKRCGEALARDERDGESQPAVIRFPRRAGRPGRGTP